MLPEIDIRQKPSAHDEDEREVLEQELATSLANVRALRDRYGWDHLRPEDWEAIRKHIDSPLRRGRPSLDRAVVELKKAKDEAELRKCHVAILRLIEKTRSGTCDAFPADLLLRRTGAREGLLFVKGREEEALQYLEQRYGFKRPVGSTTGQ